MPQQIAHFRSRLRPLISLLLVDTVTIVDDFVIILWQYTVERGFFRTRFIFAFFANLKKRGEKYPLCSIPKQWQSSHTFQSTCICNYYFLAVWSGLVIDSKNCNKDWITSLCTYYGHIIVDDIITILWQYVQKQLQSSHTFQSICISYFYFLAVKTVIKIGSPDYVPHDHYFLLNICFVSTI